MANTKKKSNVKSSNSKKNSNSINLNKKVSTTKKKLEVPDEVKKKLKETELVKKPTKKKTIETNVTVEKKVLTPEEIAKERKERNRKKYENQQKKYQTATKSKPKKKIEITTEIEDIKKKVDAYDEKKKTKKKIEVPDEVKSKKKKTVKEEELVKKTDVIDTTLKIKEKQRKEKRKTNTKTSGFTQTLTNIKEFSTTQIDIFKEKTTDKNIPIGKTEEDKKKRFKRVIRESIIYAVILTIINVICILVFDYFEFLRLFDVKALNVVITIIISLIFNFFIAFMIDHFATVIWLKRKHKKKDDDVNGDNRINKGEYKENIRNKKRK